MMVRMGRWWRIDWLSLMLMATVLLIGPAPATVLSQRQSKPVIKVVGTGGGISLTPKGPISIEQVISDIVRDFPETAERLSSVRFEVVDLMRVNSKHFTSRDFLEIARTVANVIQGPAVKGVIVTQGAFTAEETAYFLHLLVKSDKPVVIAGSLRRHATVSNDGDKNFLDAVAVVLSPESVGKGALIVSNQTINSAREAVFRSVRPDSFVSGMHGVLGVVESDGVTFYREPTRRHTVNSEFDISQIKTLPKVEIVSAYYDADPALIGAVAGLNGLKGIVINGFTTTGEPHIGQEPALQELADKGLPIVLAARSGMDNRVVVQSGNKFIEGDNLVAHKARNLLQLALTRTSDLEEIQRIFDEY